LQCLDGEKQLLSISSQIQKHLSSVSVRKYLKNLEQDAKERQKDLHQFSQEISLPVQEVECKPLHSVLKEVQEIFSFSEPSTILDTGFLLMLREGLSMQKLQYENALSLLTTIHKIKEHKSRIQSKINQIYKSEKELIKIIEGTLFSDGLEQKAYQESPLVT